MLAAIGAYLLHDPAAAVLFKIREPYFACPIKSERSRLVIRTDAGGDGEFGAKRRNGRMHAGIDIQAPVGTPIYASKSGLAFCGNVPTGYGKYVMMLHPDMTQTFYGHLSGYAITSPCRVSRGELIGFTGKTGNASRNYIEPHLHFEIRKSGEAVDPTALMK